MCYMNFDIKIAWKIIFFWRRKVLSVFGELLVCAEDKNSRTITNAEII